MFKSRAYLAYSGFLSALAFDVLQMLVEVFELVPRRPEYHNRRDGAGSVGARVAPVAVLGAAHHLSSHFGTRLSVLFELYFNLCQNLTVIFQNSLFSQILSTFGGAKSSAPRVTP